MDLEALSQQILEDDQFRAIVADKLADIVAQKLYERDAEGLLVKAGLRNLVKEQFADVIAEYTKTYYDMQPVQRQVEDALRKLTREQVVSLLVK